MKTKFFKQVTKSAFKTSAGLSLAAGVALALPIANFASTIESPETAVVVNTVQDSDFDKKFREGRDLIDREDWAKAADKFKEIIGKHPHNKSADAALYWLAFCHKKQKQFKEADIVLDRLLKDFPASSWVDDARVMKLELAAPLGKIVGANTIYQAPAGTYVTKLPEGTVYGTAVGEFNKYSESAWLGELNTTYAKTPLDREDEIKIAAFQSLLAADPKRAVDVMSSVLQPDSKASETFKMEMMRVLRRPQFIASENLKVFTTKPANSQLTPALLREPLIKGFQRETNQKVRKEIIYTLASLDDDQSADYIINLYASENDREIKKAIINSFGNSASFLVHFNSNATTKRKPEADFLMEVLRTEKDAELRRLALTNLQRFDGWAANEQAVEMLARVYDGETDEPFKISIIRSLANLKQPQATRKLLDIARNDRSDKLKLEAIYALRTSNNPEALKFLEELIR